MRNEELIYKLDNLMQEFDPNGYEEGAYDTNMIEYIAEAIENDIESVREYCRMVIDECENIFVVEKAKEILIEL